MSLTNQLVCGDCLDELRKIPEGACDLIYLDPPFNTNLKRTAPPPGRKRMEGSNQPQQHAAYADSFGLPAAYIDYMRPRVEQMRRVLAVDGSLFFHCDWRMSHHVRLMLDEVFGLAGGGDTPGVFVNEIIWHYGLGAARASRHLMTKHDVIFWYANSRHYTFNLIREAPTAAMLAKYCHTDAQGKRYMNSYGRRYVLKGGKPLDDVWDIANISPTASERVGYPTQKPLALLLRIVQLASNPGDLVLDPFCGSGTTLLAAQQCGRRWIGVDANPQAIEIAGKRLGIEIGD
ncbi:MAG: site-specific DNA-methyltransferase [Chloroflexi bacterium]|nr:site-specific DNA-methyltransferase [Chloroflexota bacterium]MCL5274317.1 site-specific DNA-methyltransferase [Chloroflexota bacterium]